MRIQFGLETVANSFGRPHHLSTVSARITGRILQLTVPDVTSAEDGTRQHRSLVRLTIRALFVGLARC